MNSAARIDRGIEPLNGTPLEEPPVGFARYMIGGILVILSLFGGFGAWAVTTEIAGAVLAAGTVVVDSSVKKVQHPTGGVVGEIHVRDGSRVEQGDLLMRLDETITRANLQIVSKQYDELIVREARLKAERDGEDDVILPAEFGPRASEAQISEVLAGERSLFATRRSTRDGQKQQLRERIEQLREEVAGIKSQTDAKGKEIELIGKELQGLGVLEQKQLVTTNRLTQLKREAARLEGESAQLRSAAAQARGKITEIELQILQIDQELKTEIVKELRDIQSKQAEYVERRVAAEDQLKRIDIRAPQSGIVHQLTAHTVGGVISPTEPIMLIVPQNDKLVVEAKIAQHDIAQARESTKAMVRLSAFNQNTTPELEGDVLRISADLTKDPQLQISYYTAMIGIPESELKKLGGQQLLPGMPADVQIRTSDRTVMSYLMRPIADQFAKTFRGR